MAKKKTEKVELESQDSNIDKAQDKMEKPSSKKTTRKKSAATKKADNAPEEEKPKKKTTRKASSSKKKNAKEENNKLSDETEEKPKKKTARKTSTTKKKTSKTDSENTKVDEEEEKPQKKTTRKKSTAKAKAEDADEAEEKPKKKTTRKKSTAKAKAKEETEDEVEEKPKKKTTRKKPTAKAKAEDNEDTDKAEEKPKKKATRKKSTTKKKTTDSEDTDKAEEKPKKKATRKKSTAKAKTKDTNSKEIDEIEKKPKKKTTSAISTDSKTRGKSTRKVSSDVITSFALVKHSEVNKKRISTPFIITLVIIVAAIPLSVFMTETTSLNIPSISVSNKAMQILTIFPVLIFMVLTLVFAKFIYERTYSFSLKEQLTEEDNPAVGISLAGYLVGIALAIIGSISHVAGSNLVESLPSIISNLIPGIVLSILLLSISQKVLDKLILYRFSIEKELATDRNLGTAAICCGGFIATGLILMNSFSAKIEQGLVEYLLAIVSAFVVGQIIFVVSGWIFTKVSRFDFHYEVEMRDNVSAGILFGGFLVGVGLVISASISNVQWENPPLFVAEYTMDDNFSQNNIKNEMVELFINNGCPLDPKAIVRSEEPRVWVIKNPGYYIQYIIVNKGDAIEVYNNNLLLITAHKAITALVAGLLAILLLLFIGVWASRLLFFRVSVTQEVEQKNPAVALVIICVYIATGFVIQALLSA